MPVEYDTSTAGSRRSGRKGEGSTGGGSGGGGILGKFGTLTRRQKTPSVPPEDHERREEEEADLVEKEGKEAIDSSLILPQPNLRNLEDGQQIRTLTVESRDDPKVLEIIELLLYWINDELASERIVVKNIQVG